MTNLDESTIRRYLSKFELAVSEAAHSANGRSFEAFETFLLNRSEVLVVELARNLKEIGLLYSTTNETQASARALLWAAWVNWLWVAKSEGRNGLDHEAKKVRPRFEAIFDETIQISRKIGRGGGRPESKGG